MILNLLPEGDPFLTKPTAEFDFKNPPCDPEELVRDLSETMVAHNAFGLAANQCGLPHRVFVMSMPETPDRKPRAFFNPVIVTSENPVSGGEGCLSFPDLFLPVERPILIYVGFENPDGSRTHMHLSNLYARGFQHELDHLNGVLFTTRVSRLVREMKFRQREKKRQK